MRVFQIEIQSRLKAIFIMKIYISVEENGWIPSPFDKKKYQGVDPN